MRAPSRKPPPNGPSSRSATDLPRRPQTTEDLWPTRTAAPRATQGNNGEMFAKLDADLFMANQLFRVGRSARVLEGVTGATDRRERIRAEILRADLADRSLRECEETFAQAFLRLYHEPLVTA